MTLGKSILAVVLAGTIGATPAPAHAQAAPGAQPEAVTLITGDRVVLTGRGHRVEPGPGRQAAFFTKVRDGHLHVIPSDAAPLLAQGVLDRRLFDVTQLLAWGYGDADTPDIPVIEQGVSTGSPQVRRLSALGMNAARVPKKSATQTWRTLTGSRTLVAGRTKLWLDGRRSPYLNESVKQVGAPQAWQQGFAGKGVKVAVLDTGYDPDHPDLKDAVVAERNFTNDPDIRDTSGHGTHVASIVAGRGEKYRGVAPEASLAIGKVGTIAGITESAALAGLEWAAIEVKARVVNLSWGGPDGPEQDPVEQAVTTLSERTGTLFVAATGNSVQTSVGSPSSTDAALAVGAVDKQGRMTGYSSRGPRTGDHAIKPDVTAPGEEITAAVPGGDHEVMGGTSMAAPHVTGAAAILAQRHPDWTGAQLKAALIGSAAPVEDATPYDQGTGTIDLVRALRQQVVAEQPNVWAAFPWNESGDRTAAKTITYANSGDTPVTLELSADGEVLKLSSEQVTVPAGGEASVTLTIDARGKAPGDYPGTVTARSGETVVRTLAGAYVEPESYDVTVNVVSRQGEPIDPADAEVYDAETGAVHVLAFRNGTATVRLPEGDWNLYTATFEKVDGTVTETFADRPLKVDGGDQRITVDHRKSKPTQVTVDDPGAQLTRETNLGLEHGAWGNWSSSNLDANSETFVVPAASPGLTYTLGTTWLSKDVSPSPYVYTLVDRRTGGIPDDPTYHAEREDLAKVTATYRASGTPGTGIASVQLTGSGPLGAMVVSLVRGIELPGRLVHYRTPGLPYAGTFGTGTGLISADSGTAEPGSHTTEVWNAAVTGPSFRTTAGERTGDELSFPATGMFADGRPGSTGTDSAATGTATLTRDGETLATADLAACYVPRPERCELRADLPAGSGDYTLTASLRREAPLSTEVTSAWTFSSATTTERRALPLMAVRYSPEGLDDFNRAEPGATTRLPVWVERNPGAAEAEVREIRLEMSADDGATWRAVPVERAGSRWIAQVSNPAGPGFVSLRATVTDTAGAGVTQTVIRAYAVGG